MQSYHFQCKSIPCMTTFDILHSDLEGFVVTGKCCCFVLFPRFTWLVDEKWYDSPVNDGLHGVFF